jgi:hypothetical protein
MPGLSFGRRLLIALAGYGLIAIFGGIYWELKQHTEHLSTNQLLILSAVGVVPLALALIWEYLKGVKVGKVEIKLSDVSPALDVELADKLAQLAASVTPDLAALITAAVQRRDFRLVEINLRNEDYWWSTRLYLVAALASDYTEIERLVIVRQHAERIFVGTASPAGVRKALAQRFPQLEEFYLGHQVNANSLRQGPVSSVEYIVNNWTMSFGRIQVSAGQPPMTEERFKEFVTVAKLRDWLANALETTREEYRGGRPTRALYARILSCNVPYVPLVQGNRLKIVVNRHELAAKLATAVLS